MICYSDFILSLRPWSYCRLDEPVGYNLYLDSSGNGSHLKSEVEGVVANNRQPISFTGDPFVAGIHPMIETQRLSFGSVDFEVYDTSLRLDVPVFKSDSWIYRRREKIQNDLVINSMWLEITIDTDTPSYHEYMKNWVPPLHSYSGSSLAVDHLYLEDDFSHIDALAGGRLFSSLSQRTQPYVMHETFLRFGSLALVGITGVHYNYDGTYLGHSYRLSLITQVLKNDEWVEKLIWSRTLVTEDQVLHPASPLAGSHRFTIGIINPKTYYLMVKVSIDGGETETITVVLPEDESFVAYEHEVYSTCALMNDTTFSNLAVFFNSPFPSNEWLAASQKALIRPYSAPIAEDISILHGRSLSGFPALEKLPGSLFNTLNGILFLGTNQRLVTQMFKTDGSPDLIVRITPTIPGIAVGNTIKINQNKQSPFSGCWKVYAINTTNQIAMIAAVSTSIPASITLNNDSYDRSYQFMNDGQFIAVLRTKTIHYFSIGDLVTVHHLTDTDQAHTWSVTAVDADGFDIVAQNIQADYVFNDDCIVKQTPVGGGCWTKTFSDNVIGFGYRDIEAYKRNILIDDRELSYSKVSLSKIDNSDTSENLFIPKDIKSIFNREKDRFTSKAVGDCHRLYCFFPARQNTVSHTSIITFGEVYDWFNQDWCCVALVSISKEKDQDSGFNLAMAYPDWAIDQNTGFLVCRSFKSHLSQGYLQIEEDEGVTTSSGYGDTGQHVYPINIPYISFVP